MRLTKLAVLGLIVLSSVAIALYGTIALGAAGPETLEPNPCNGPGHLATKEEADSVPDGSIIAGETFICSNDAVRGINNKVGAAKDYLISIPKKPLSNCAPPTPDNIRKLNDTFAVCAANFLKAFTQKYGGVYITSAYRDKNSGANQCAGGAENSNHTRGLAMDVRPDNENLYPTIWKFASDNPEFGVCFPFQDKALNGYPNGDRPHMILAGIGGSEAAKCAVQGVKSPCSGVPFNPKAVPGAVAGSGGVKSDAAAAAACQKYTNPAEYGTCVANYQRSTRSGASSASLGNVTTCKTVGFVQQCTTSIGESNPFNSNGLFGGNSDLMQLMLGMQLGQGLGQLMGGLFNGSGNANTTPASAALPPAPLPPTPVSTTPATTPASTGSSTIDALIAALKNPVVAAASSTPASTPIVVGSSTVGQLQPVSLPPSTTTDNASSSVLTLPSITLSTDSSSTFTYGTASVAIASGSQKTSGATSTLQAIADGINAMIASLKNALARLVGL